MKSTCLTSLAVVFALVPFAVAAEQATPAPELVAYTALREAKLSGEVATVSNLTLKRDAGTFALKSGELHFLAPVEGRVAGAVFVGDGEFTLTPPLECERQALAIYTKNPTLVEHFDELVLRFQVPLPQKPKRAAINALDDVLCVETANVQK